MWNIIKNLSVADILYIIVTAVSIVFGVISFLKARKNAKNSNEEFLFQENLLQEIINAMETCEKTLSPLKNALGTSISSMKLDNVIQKVQNYCLSNGRAFDKEKVEKLINDLIGFSKIVNYKKSV
jgi:hypothetical protein